MSNKNKYYLKKDVVNKLETIIKILKKVDDILVMPTIGLGGKWIITGGLIPKLYNFVGSSDVVYQTQITKIIQKFKNEYKDCDIDAYFVGTKAEFDRNMVSLNKRFAFEESGLKNYGDEAAVWIHYSLNTSNFSNIITNKISLMYHGEYQSKFEITKDFDFRHCKPLYDTHTACISITPCQIESIKNKQIQFNRAICDVDIKRLEKWINTYGFSLSEYDAKVFNTWSTEYEYTTDKYIKKRV